MPIYEAKPRRKVNWCTGAAISPVVDGGVRLILFSRQGAPFSACWYDTLTEAQAEALEMLGIEPSDWVESSNEAAVQETADLVNEAVDEAVLQLQEAQIFEGDSEDSDRVDESSTALCVERVDVGSLTEDHVRDYEVFADFYQFYLWDIGIDPGAPADYENEDSICRVKVAYNCVVILTARNTTVPVQIEVRPKAPEEEDGNWDHIVDCSLHLPTGRLQLCTSTCGEVADWQLPGGMYRVRAYFCGLGEVNEDGIGGNDHYRVVVWPGGEVPLKVLKQWIPSETKEH